MNTNQAKCECGQPGKPVRVETIPGSFDSKETTVSVCDTCYYREQWWEVDLDVIQLPLPGFVEEMV